MQNKKRNYKILINTLFVIIIIPLVQDALSQKMTPLLLGLPMGIYYLLLMVVFIIAVLINVKPIKKLHTSKAKPKFIDREKLKLEIQDSLREYDCIKLVGDHGIGKTTLIINALNEIELFPYGLTEKIYIDINTDIDYETLIRKIYSEIFTKWEESIEKCHSLILKELKNKYLVVIDLSDNLTINSSKIIRFFERIITTESKLVLISCFNISKLVGRTIKIGALELPDRKEIVYNYIRKLPKSLNGINYKLLSKETSILSENISNTKQLLQAIDTVILFGGNRDINEIMKTTEGEQLEIYWKYILLNQSALSIVLTLSLLSFPPTAEDLLLISGLSKKNFNEGIDYLFSSNIITCSSENNRYSLDTKIRNFIIENGTKTYLNLIRQIEDNLITWVSSIAKIHGGNKNWTGYKFLEEYLDTIVTVMDYCLDREMYQDIINIWKDIDHFLSLKGNWDLYIKVGKKVETAAKSNEEEYAFILACVKSEVLGYSYLRKSYTDTNEIKEQLNLAKQEFKQSIKYFKCNGYNRNLYNAKRYLARVLIIKSNYSDCEKQNCLNEARKDLKKAEKFFANDYDNLGPVLDCLGDVERFSGNLEKAEEYQKRRLNLAEKQGQFEYQASAHYQLGRIYQTREDLDSLLYAKDHFQKAAQLAKDNFMGELYIAANRRGAEVNLLNNDYPDAKLCINNAIEKAKELDLNQDIFNKILSEINEKEEKAKMTCYHEDLPEQVVPEKLPLRKMAPCWAGGRVNTVDYDSKDVICNCEFCICYVDNKNIIINTIPKKKGEDAC